MNVIDWSAASDNDCTLLGICGLYKITLKPFLFLLYVIFCDKEVHVSLGPCLSAQIN